MKLRLLFTVAAATALLAVPLAAQTQFHWHPGDDAHVRVRTIERWANTVDRITRHVERTADRVARQVERSVDRTIGRTVSRYEWRAEALAEQIEARIHANVHSRVRSIIDAHVHASDWVDGQGSFSSDPCRDNGRRDRDDYYTHCEVREERLPAGPLSVNASPNGGIQIEAWDRNDIHVRAIVQTHGRELDEAKALAGQVQIQAGGGRVSANGPDMSGSGRRWWSVSYRINVPRQTDLDLNSINGGISITGVSGTQRFDTTNGGVTLRALSGSVRGETNNGGLTVVLDGQRWDGDGLDVETSNGGVTLSIPDGYNAQLEARTVNGGFHFDYPMTIVGDLTPRRGISTTLGSGGAPVRVRTNNGGLRIQRR